MKLIKRWIELENENDEDSVFERAQVLPLNLTGSLFSQIDENAINVSKLSSIEEALHTTKRERQLIELIADSYTNK